MFKLIEYITAIGELADHEDGYYIATGSSGDDYVAFAVHKSDGKVVSTYSATSNGEIDMEWFEAQAAAVFAQVDPATDDHEQNAVDDVTAPAPKKRKAKKGAL